MHCLCIEYNLICSHKQTKNQQTLDTHPINANSLECWADPSACSAAPTASNPWTRYRDKTTWRNQRSSGPRRPSARLYQKIAVTIQPIINSTHQIANYSQSQRTLHMPPSKFFSHDTPLSSWNRPYLLVAPALVTFFVSPPLSACIKQSPNERMHTTQHRRQTNAIQKPTNTRCSYNSIKTIAVCWNAAELRRSRISAELSPPPSSTRAPAAPAAPAVHRLQPKYGLQPCRSVCDSADSSGRPVCTDAPKQLPIDGNIAAMRRVHHSVHIVHIVRRCNQRRRTRPLKKCLLILYQSPLNWLRTRCCGSCNVCRGVSERVRSPRENVIITQIELILVLLRINVIKKYTEKHKFDCEKSVVYHH